MADLDLAELRRLAEAARRLAPADVTEALWASYLAIRADDDSYARLTNNDLSRLAAAVMPLFDRVFPEPAVVLQLLDRLEAAEAALAKARADEYRCSHRHEPGTAEALCGAALTSLDHSGPKRRVYVFPLPCLGLVISWRPESGATP